MSFRGFTGVLMVLAAAQELPAGRTEFSYASALPARKHAVEVVLHRNPFCLEGEVERPLPVLHDKEDPALRTSAYLAPMIRSVIRSPEALVLIGTTVTRPGDEIRVDASSPLAASRMVLRSIGDDRLIVRVTSLSAQRPGELDVFVPLPPGMARR